MAKIVTATVTFTLHEELEDELEGTSSALYDRMLEMHIRRALEEGGIAKDEHARASIIKIEDNEIINVREFFKMGYDAFSKGHRCPEGAMVEQAAEWKRGWDEAVHRAMKKEFE